MTFKYLLALLVVGTMLSKAQENLPAYQNLELSFEERARDLVGRMTLEEKVSQLVHDAKAIERLGIPAYNWMNECLHGVANIEGYATVFPQAIGMAASFNQDLMLDVASAISSEARAMHHNGIRNAEEGYVCGLTFWSPNINLFRDPRWGRGQETYGEDPYLTGRMAIPFIKGLQGDHPKYLKTVATVKHYVVHSGPEESRHEFNTLSDERDFWESYMPHFITATKEADVQSVVRVPIRSLQAFKRIHLQPGKRQRVAFALEPHQMTLLNDDMELMVEPGEFEILIGFSSENIKLKESIIVTD